MTALALNSTKTSSFDLVKGGLIKWQSRQPPTPRYHQPLKPLWMTTGAETKRQSGNQTIPVSGTGL